MTNEEILKAQIETASGGQLTAEQAKQFIDTVIAENELLQKVLTVPMSASEYKLNSLGITNRQMRKVTQGIANTTITGVNILERSLVPVEVSLDYDITDSFLEENIEGGSAEAKINSAFARAFGNDVSDLGFNGDVSLTSDDFIKIADGWIKTATADSATHKLPYSGDNYLETILPGLLAQMPDKWKQNLSSLVYLVAPSEVEKYKQQLATRLTGLGDAILVNGGNVKYGGIEVYPANFLSANNTLLTTWKNLAVGIGRQMRVEKMRQPRKRIVEYTITAKVAFNYAVSDLLVIGTKS